MSTFALIQTVAVDLPIADNDADLGDYAQSVVDAVGTRSDVIVVGHYAALSNPGGVADALLEFASEL